MTAPRGISTKRILAIGLLLGAFWGGSMFLFSLGGSFKGHVTTEGVDVQRRDVPPIVVLVQAVAWTIGGLAFGGLMAAFLAYQRRREAKNPIDLEPGESLLADAPANHMKGWVAVGGWLYLTERRLRFRSHKANLKWNHDESYPLARITGAEPRTALGIITNGMTVFLDDGREEKFVVHQAKAWLEELEKARAASQAPPAPPAPPASGNGSAP